MYNTLKKLIPVGGYKLENMQAKIKKMYLLGDLDEAQMDELLSMTLANLSPDAERPDYAVMFKTLSDRIEALETRIKAIEGGDDSGEETTSEYPAWEPWDGISDKYQYGSVVSHNGKLWKSVYNGQNVWEPGVYGWEVVQLS